MESTDFGPSHRTASLKTDDLPIKRHEPGFFMSCPFLPGGSCLVHFLLRCLPSRHGCLAKSVLGTFYPNTSSFRSGVLPSSRAHLNLVPRKSRLVCPSRSMPSPVRMSTPISSNAP